MKWLLLLLLMVIAGEAKGFEAEVGRQSDILIISLPELPQDEKYGEVWVTIGRTVYSEVDWLSPNSFSLAAEGHSGSLEVVVCGPTSCRVEQDEWTLRHPLVVGSWLILLLGGGLFCLWKFGKT